MFATTTNYLKHEQKQQNYTVGQCNTQTADYCFYRANENVTTIVPLFSDPKNNSAQSVRSLHFTLPHYAIGGFHCHAIEN